MHFLSSDETETFAATAESIYEANLRIQAEQHFDQAAGIAPQTCVSFIVSLIPAYLMFLQNTSLFATTLDC